MDTLITIICAWMTVGGIIYVVDSIKIAEYYGPPTLKKVLEVIVLWPYVQWKIRKN